MCLWAHRHSFLLSLLSFMISQFLEQAIREQNHDSVRCYSQQPHPGLLLAKQNPRATLDRPGASRVKIAPNKIRQ